MTLARRFYIATTVLVASLLAVSGAALWGITGLSENLNVALSEYRKLRSVYEIGPGLARARAMLDSGDVKNPRVLVELEAASFKFDQLLGVEARREVAIEALHDLVERLQAPEFIAPPKPAEQLAILNNVMGYLARIGSQTNDIIEATQRDATRQRRLTITAVASMAGAITLLAFAVTLWQYRRIMTPIARLRRSVHGIASGRFNERLEEGGDRELAELSRDFNHMAEELDELYRDLEAKVAAKSKELVRSERLASVGFLAAGVAHEINNPLGIISGYAELAQRKLAKKAENAGEEASKSLHIIFEESQRCKQIIQKLLTLARGGDDQRGPVSLGKVARDVADLIHGLPRYRNRTLEVRGAETARDAELTVIGNETELKQVALNLVINALEASHGTPNSPVIIETQRSTPNPQTPDPRTQPPHRVTLRVTDHGKGMTSDVLDRIFEPFYTEKRGAPRDGEEPGTGLGLSISHAIVTSHGGTLHAESDGPGNGARFTVELAGR